MMKRPPLVTIRVSLRERDRLHKRAEAAGLSLNQWCREQLGLDLDERSYWVRRVRRMKRKPVDGAKDE